MNTSAVGCQADLLPIDDDEDDCFTSSVSNITTPRIDAQTQLDENDVSTTFIIITSLKSL